MNSDLSQSANNDSGAAYRRNQIKSCCFLGILFICLLIALVLSVVWNFTLNRKFTFKSAANVPIAMAKVLAYYAVFTPLSTLLGEYLAGTLGWNEYLVTVINMLLNFGTEFLYQRTFVFGKSLDTGK